jgi:hypothetical protein
MQPAAPPNTRIGRDGVTVTIEGPQPHRTVSIEGPQPHRIRFVYSAAVPAAPAAEHLLPADDHDLAPPPRIRRPWHQGVWVQDDTDDAADDPPPPAQAPPVVASSHDTSVAAAAAFEAAAGRAPAPPPPVVDTRHVSETTFGVSDQVWPLVMVVQPHK